MVGVQIQANIADVPVIVTAEPRPAIIAFLVSTLWKFAQFEWLARLHHEHYHTKQQQLKNIDNNTARIVNEEGNIHTTPKGEVVEQCLPSSGNGTDERNEENSLILHQLRFQDWEIDTRTGERKILLCKSQFCLQGFVSFLMIAALVLLIVGSFTECLTFTTLVGDNTVHGCQKGYNLYTLGTAMIQDNFMDGNSAKVGTWFMFLNYIVLVGVFPWFVIIIQIYIMGLRQQQPYQLSRMLCRTADIIWSFASIEILLLAIIVVQVQ
jgi:hypothetical protein